MGVLSYKSLIERKLGVRFKPSEQEGFQYLALGEDSQEFTNSEYRAQFDASLMIMVQNKDRQYRMYTKKFRTGVMINQRYEGKGYKDLYNKIIEIKK